MDKEFAKKYYSRPSIQERLLHFANQKEIGTRFDGFFGKRPSVLENKFDLKQLIEKGIFSFHMSEERWANVLMLGSEKSQEEKDKNRTGWDLILDLDGVDYEYAQITGEIIIEYLTSLGVKNVSTKFSGNKGFHIGIPFEAFSQEILGIGKTKELFPEAAQKIAIFLMHELRGKISKAILDHTGTIEEIAKKYNIELSELISKDEKSYYLNYTKLIEIDTIAITSRHLIRMPYSLHEKSKLVSIPVENNRIRKFQRNEAQVNLVNPKNYEKFEFLVYNSEFGKDADILLVKAYEDGEVYEAELEEKIKELNQIKRGHQKGIIFTGGQSGEYFEIEHKIEYEDFPKTIKYILEHEIPDGKKRAQFVLMSFLYSVNYSPEEVETYINEWNQKQEAPLRQNYLSAQYHWFKSRESKISPPNFNSKQYYYEIGIPQEIIDEDKKAFRNITCKNPLHYAFILEQRKGNSKEE